MALLGTGVRRVTDPREVGEGEPADGTSVGTDDGTPKVNWVPTVAAVGAFVWWLVIAAVFYQRYPELHDQARFIGYVLLGGVLVTAIPALLRQALPHVSPLTRRAGVVLLYLVVAIPLVLALTWSAYDSLVPVQRRQDGSIPNIASLVGRNQHDVSRILGSADVVADAPLTLSQGSDPSQVGNAQAERLVVYSLPDLNSLDGRPEKRAAQHAESKKLQQQFGAQVTPDDWNSDALVMVYYGAESTVVGTRMDLSLASASKALSDVTSQTVVSAAGLVPRTSTASADTQGVSSASGGSLERVMWGGGNMGDTPMGYRLGMGGIAYFATDAVPAVVLGSPEADSGDVTLSIAPGLTDPASRMVADASGLNWQTGVAVGSPDDQAPHGNDLYCEDTFWIVVCSQPYDTEGAALARAKVLNARGGKTAGHFSVERSGHLAGLQQSDFWIVIYDVGYSSEDGANKAADGLWGTSLTGPRVALITKKCGDATITRVVQ